MIAGHTLQMSLSMASWRSRRPPRWFPCSPGRVNRASRRSSRHSWLQRSAAYYPDVAYDTVVTQAARGLARELATRCPGESLDGLAMVLMLAELGDEPILVLPPSEAFRTRLEENEPNGDFAAPLVVAQGLADVIVLPQVTAEFVAGSVRRRSGDCILDVARPGSPQSRAVRFAAGGSADCLDAGSLCRRRCRGRL